MSPLQSPLRTLGLPATMAIEYQEEPPKAGNCVSLGVTNPLAGSR